SSFPGREFTINSFEMRIESLNDYLLKNEAMLYGCEKNNELIGFIWFFVKNKETIHINHFVVDEQYQGLGIGKLLWEQVEKYASKEALKEIELFVTKSNETAVSFYTKRDFEVKRFVMKKRLL